MLTHLQRLRQRRTVDESGFTLIELLVVVVIIGILIAIAIPVYLNYQKGAKDKSAASDLRNAVAVLEQCNSDNGTYPLAALAIAAAAPSGIPCTNQVINTSNGSSFKYFPSSTTSPATSYLVTSTKSGGSGKIYCYASAAGGAIATISADKTAYAATC